MIQTFDEQLQVVLRALKDVVAPALTGAEKHVTEQLHLCMVTLSYVKTRLPDARRYFRMELSSYIALAEAAVGIAQGNLGPLVSKLSGDVAAGKAELQQSESDIEEYRAITMCLREQLAALSNAAVGTPCKETLDRMILEKSGDLLMQYRLWCAPFGFELKPEDLPKPAW
jgi:hypothetical protein